MPKPITASMLYDLVSCLHRRTMNLFAIPAQRDESNQFIKQFREFED